MSIGNEIAYRRSARGRMATGSLVFDQQRKQVGEHLTTDAKQPSTKAANSAV